MSVGLCVCQCVGGIEGNVYIIYVVEDELYTDEEGGWRNRGRKLEVARKVDIAYTQINPITSGICVYYVGRYYII